MEQKFSLAQLEQSRNVHDIKALDSLRKAAVSGDEKALNEAAKQFEAIFVQMMLKSMRAAQDVMSDKDSPFNSQQVKFYREMHDQQLATDLSTNGSMGLAELIVKQLGPLQPGYTPANIIRNDGNLDTIDRNRIKSRPLPEQVSYQQPPQTVTSDTEEKRPLFASPKDFVAALMPVAEKIASKIGLDGRALLAQAAVETGWGKKIIHSPKGESSYNLFGIKADRSWQGDKAYVNTLEYENGVAKPQKAHFRSYGSFVDSMQDYVDFIQNNPRYSEALNQTQDPKAYFDALQQAGYATDPAYADKVMSVFNGSTMNQASVSNNKQAQDLLYSAKDVSYSNSLQGPQIGSDHLSVAINKSRSSIAPD